MLACLIPAYRMLSTACGANRPEALSTCLQGFLQTALVVSSFHVLDIAAADGVVERTVRILYGEGDRYGCWLDIVASAIVWHELSDPAAMLPAGQPAAGMATGSADEVWLSLHLFASSSDSTNEVILYSSFSSSLLQQQCSNEFCRCHLRRA